MAGYPFISCKNVFLYVCGGASSNFFDCLEVLSGLNRHKELDCLHHSSGSMKLKGAAALSLSFRRN